MLEINAIKYIIHTCKLNILEIFLRNKANVTHTCQLWKGENNGDITNDIFWLSMKFKTTIGI